MSTTELSAATLPPEADAESPLPLGLCWLIWIGASLALWALLLSPFM